MLTVSLDDLDDVRLTVLPQYVAERAQHAVVSTQQQLHHLIHLIRIRRLSLRTTYSVFAV